MYTYMYYLYAYHDYMHYIYMLAVERNVGLIADSVKDVKGMIVDCVIFVRI